MCLSVFWVLHTFPLGGLLAVRQKVLHSFSTGSQNVVSQHAHHHLLRYCALGVLRLSYVYTCVLSALPLSLVVLAVKSFAAQAERHRVRGERFPCEFVLVRSITNKQRYMYVV